MNLPWFTAKYCPRCASHELARKRPPRASEQFCSTCHLVFQVHGENFDSDYEKESAPHNFPNRPRPQRKRVLGLKYGIRK